MNGSNLRANVHSNADFAVVYAQAYNDYLIDTWLDDPRLYGSMMIAPQDIERSVKEIHRIGKHPKIVQVLMSSASPMLYGKRYFWPIYEAASELGLPVAIHTFVMIEGGIAWAPAIAWRLDKNYKALRSEVPWLTKLPSEYIKDRVRFTTQPIEEPEDEKLLVRLFEEINGYETIMFASDYPHWDFDDPFHVMRGFPEDLKRRIYYENAAALYGFPPLEKS